MNYLIFNIQGLHTVKISKFPTISQPFRSSSPTIFQSKLHGSHDFSETKLPTIAICFQNVQIISVVFFLTEPFDSKTCCTNLTNSQSIPGWE